MSCKINESEAEFIKKFFPIFGRRYCIRKLGKTISQIESYVLRNNIKSNKSFECDINDYLDIFTPKIIYGLGFLWADGCVSKSSKNSYFISVAVTKADDIYIKNIFDTWGHMTWHTSHRPAKNSISKSGRAIIGKPQTVFYLSDKYFSNFLVRNDYKIKSGASPDKILSLIPEHLKHYWWRGYFDGDGSFYYKRGLKIQISSVVYQDWSFFNDLCKNIDIKFSWRKATNSLGKSSSVTVNTNNDCIKLMDYFYKDMEIDGIGYKRKYDKYKEANLVPIVKTSIYKGVCLDKSKRINPWVCYFYRTYLGCFSTQEEAYNYRQKYLKENNITE